MLILFDIDATLLTTTRAGIKAMGSAGRELYGPAFDEHAVEYSGRLDPLIIRDLLTVHGHPAHEAAMDAFRAGYRKHLGALLEDRSLARPCPGVMALLDAIPATREITLGLLTGNFPETGGMKLRAAGIDPDRFKVAAWGCDSPHSPPARDHLPPVAMDRQAARTGRRPDPRSVVIIGDTPHDVACARAHGLRSLAVATGLFSVAQLEASGADRTVATLEDTSDIVSWLVGAPVRTA
jgi:phosphoglycolate phosphatase-like HAD superfamily hydrolase